MEPGHGGWEGTAPKSNHDPKVIEYDERVRFGTAKWAILEQMKSPPAGFEEVLKAHFLTKRHVIVQTIQSWIEKGTQKSKTDLGPVLKQINAQFQKMTADAPAKVKANVTAKAYAKAADKARAKAEEEAAAVAKAEEEARLKAEEEAAAVAKAEEEAMEEARVKAEEEAAAVAKAEEEARVIKAAEGAAVAKEIAKAKAEGGSC
jgi:membrane protein involved in colicin uptake